MIAEAGGELILENRVEIWHCKSTVFLLLLLLHQSWTKGRLHGSRKRACLRIKRYRHVNISQIIIIRCNDFLSKSSPSIAFAKIGLLNAERFEQEFSLWSLVDIYSLSFTMGAKAPNAGTTYYLLLSPWACLWFFLW